ncbi:hypothetical protein Bwad005_17630 [Bilophila wadsworthia]|uniref:hypothetical protein n=1 Tax=uncultured Bilophila sp. TaxID=529385 RepID=UPI002597987D|nr:hypothetical protein [uncultured Bilophila sp.]
MSATVFLSRSGRCAGRVPLSLLLQKLARLGENAAIAALCDLPLSLRSRVRWMISGNVLFLEADGSHAACGVLNEQGGRGRACLAAHPSRRREWSKEVA